MRGRIDGLTIGLDGKQRLSFIMDGDVRETFDELKDDELEITVKKYRKKRSLTANAYCWVLMDKLAEVLNISKIEVYRNMIREIGGVSDLVEVSSEASEKLMDAWVRNGTGWICDREPSSEIGFDLVRLYYGSSTYDSKQMAALIDAVVHDCRIFGIETASPAQIELYKEEWKP